MTHRKLKYIRRILRMTQAELSKATGIRQSYLSKYESGTKRIKPDAERKIVAAFEERRDAEIKQLQDEIELLNRIFSVDANDNG